MPVVLWRTQRRAFAADRMIVGRYASMTARRKRFRPVDGRSQSHPERISLSPAAILAYSAKAGAAPTRASGLRPMFSHWDGRVDRESGGLGGMVSVRLVLGVRRLFLKKTNHK